MYHVSFIHSSVEPILHPVLIYYILQGLLLPLCLQEALLRGVPTSQARFPLGVMNILELELVVASMVNALTSAQVLSSQRLIPRFIHCTSVVLNRK